MSSSEKTTNLFNSLRGSLPNPAPGPAPTVPIAAFTGRRSEPLKVAPDMPAEVVLRVHNLFS